MQHYLWFHPSYLQESEEDLIAGQKKNAKAHHYTVLNNDELHKVCSGDHLTIIGHTTRPPKKDENELADTGLYIQGETAEECIQRLKNLGLRCGPKILTLESCYAGLADGIAQQLSKHPFFKYSLIEANLGAVGRNYGKNWCVPTDSLGRSVITTSKSLWVFYLKGCEVLRHYHGDYELEQVLDQIKPQQFQQCFFSNYHPGWLGGRVGRYCSKGTALTLAKALFFAQENTNSATADALDLTLEQLYHK